MKMRTIDQCVTYLKTIDPETALTKTAIRRMVVTGELPSVRVGTKYLVSLEALEAYLKAGRSLTPVQPACGSIRPVGIRG